MAEKAIDLWTFPVFYFLRTVGGDLRHFGVNITWRMVYDPVSTVSLDSITAAAAANRGKAREFLAELMQCETRVATTPAENAATGRYSATAESFRPLWATHYAADIIHDTHQSRVLQGGDDADGGEVAGGVGGPSEGKLGTCTKGWPVSKKFTPGMFTCQCPCSRPCVSSWLLMDSHESPRHVFETFFYSRDQDQAPHTIIYDASCKAHAYAMAREPDFFFSTRFISDRFHEGNHRTCAWRYRNSVYERVAPNTPAAEQMNAKLEKHVKKIRGFNMVNVVQAMNIFILLNNLDAHLAMD